MSFTDIFIRRPVLACVVLEDKLSASAAATPTDPEPSLADCFDSLLLPDFDFARSVAPFC